MNTLADTARKAICRNGQIVVTMASGREIRFPVSGNPRLARGTAAQLNHIEISPFGLHWPDLDEDLSFHGLVEGDFGQRQPAAVAESPARYSIASHKEKRRARKESRCHRRLPSKPATPS